VRRREAALELAPLALGRELPPRQRLAGLRLVNRRREGVPDAGILPLPAEPFEPQVEAIGIAARQLRDAADAQQVQVTQHRRADVAQGGQCSGLVGGHR